MRTDRGALPELLAMLGIDGGGPDDHADRAAVVDIWIRRYLRTLSDAEAHALVEYWMADSAAPSEHRQT